VRLFLCVFFFLSFTHSSSHVLHDFELSSSSSFKSKFCLVRPFSFHQEHVRTSNVEKRLQKKKKKKKRGGGEKKGQPKDASFSEPSLKVLLLCVAH
jgi:hypothetical protein